MFPSGGEGGALPTVNLYGGLHQQYLFQARGISQVEV